MQFWVTERGRQKSTCSTDRAVHRSAASSPGCCQVRKVYITPVYITPRHGRLLAFVACCARRKVFLPACEAVHISPRVSQLSSAAVL
jgi:hypothetical protein